MRVVLPLAILSVVPTTVFAQPAPAAEVEVVTGFHGYPWGIKVENIEELGGTAQVGERDGYPIYSARVQAMGWSGLAGFYFHPETGELLEGAYVFALTVDNCEIAWRTVTAVIERDFPTLVPQERIPRRGDVPDRQVYASDCEYFAFNSHRETWTTDYVNPDPPGDRVLLWLKTVERMPRLTVVFRGGRSQAWIENRNAGR